MRISKLLLQGMTQTIKQWMGFLNVNRNIKFFTQEPPQMLTPNLRLAYTTVQSLKHVQDAWEIIPVPNLMKAMDMMMFCSDWANLGIKTCVQTTN